MNLTANATESAQSSFSREMIESQQQSLSKMRRFPFMSFEAGLEPAFETFQYQRLSKRIPVISLTGIILFAVFSILDFFSLPQAVYQTSIPLRLLLICPLIALVMFLAAKAVNSKLFFRVYFSVYIIAGLLIISIIYQSDLYGYYLPYDGILLHLVFGYFLMGLPYRLAMYGGLFISMVYVMTSWDMNLPVEKLASNSIFIISFNFIGVIGSYMQERARRLLFLNEAFVVLAKAKDEKEIASKTRLVAIASHDLRQPLHAMNLLIETLQGNLPEAEQKAIVHSLDISIKQLSQLLNMLLDISKLNVGIVEPMLERLNLAEKVATICNEQRLRLKASNLSLTYDGSDSLFVRVDPVLFDRIIRNVMENIFVHAEASEVIFSWKSENAKVRLDIIDNGVGIAEQDLNTIFDEFQQSGDSSGTGMGLGLTIVKQLAELQGIEYGLISGSGKGSCFWLSIPLDKQQEAAQLAPLAKVTIIKKVSSSYAEAWADQFKSWGYCVDLLPLGLHMQTDHIRRVLSAQSQVLVWDANDDTDIQSVFDQLQTLQADFKFSLPVLIVTHTEALAIPAPENVLVEVVSPSVRPAKLRMILAYLARDI